MLNNSSKIKYFGQKQPIKVLVFETFQYFSQNSSIKFLMSMLKQQVNFSLEFSLFFNVI